MSLPLSPFTTEEITAWINEAAKGANKAARDLLYCIFDNIIHVFI